MNALFHLNMQAQIQAVANMRLQVKQTIALDGPPKGSAAYDYLCMIFSQRKATSQELNTVRNGNNRMPYDTLKLYIKREYITFERTGNYGGIYRPADGITAEMLDLDLDGSDE